MATFRSNQIEASDQSIIASLVEMDGEMNVHLLVEEPTRPFRIDVDLTIQETTTGYTISTRYGEAKSSGETPQDALLNFLREALESIHAFQDKKG